MSETRGKKPASSSEVFAVLSLHAAEVRKFGVKKLGLFGSYARGTAVRGSDLDFLVEFEKSTFDGYMGLKFYLEGLFDTRVDLVVADAIKSRLRQSILAETKYVPGL